MSDLISREDLKEAFEDLFYNDVDDQERTERLIENAPTVKSFTEEDMAGAYNEGYACGGRESKRPQGEWNEIQAGMLICPFCGARPHKDFKNFCAKCGAKMRGGAV